MTPIKKHTAGRIRKRNRLQKVEKGQLDGLERMDINSNLSPGTTQHRFSIKKILLVAGKTESLQGKSGKRQITTNACGMMRLAELLHVPACQVHSSDSNVTSWNGSERQYVKEDFAFLRNWYVHAGFWICIQNHWIHLQPHNFISGNTRAEAALRPA